MAYNTIANYRMKWPNAPSVALYFAIKSIIEIAIL